MLHTFRQLRLCIIILAFAALSFGVGGKTILCVMPDGDVHLEPSLSPCCFAGECDADYRLRNQVHCLDVSLGGEAANQHHENIVQLPLLAMAPPGPPSILAPHVKKPSRAIHLPPPPLQLVSLRSVILLI